MGDAEEMTNRSQTLYSITDSLVGRAVWMTDHDLTSCKLIARIFDGQRDG